MEPWKKTDTPEINARIYLIIKVVYFQEEQIMDYLIIGTNILDIYLEENKLRQFLLTNTKIKSRWTEVLNNKIKKL